MFGFTDTKALSEAGAWVHITNADTGRPAYWLDKDGTPDKSRPVRIKVMGGDAPELQRRIAKRAAKLIKKRGSKTDITKMSEAELAATIEEAPEGKAEDAADATIGWENIPGSDGKPVPFSRENAVALYLAFPAVVRNVQAITGGDMADFISAALEG